MRTDKTVVEPDPLFLVQELKTRLTVHDNILPLYGLFNDAGGSPVDRPLTFTRIVSGLLYVNNFNLTEVHMTLSLSGRLNSQRKRSLVSTVLLHDIISRQSVSMSEILLLHTLYDSLGGGTLRFCESEKIAQTVILIEGIIVASRNAEFTSLDDTHPIPKSIVNFYTEQLPSKEVIDSWRVTYSPNKAAKMRIVQVDQNFRFDGYDNYERDSERYSGYSRGYDDHGGTPAPGRTRKSAELDGLEPVAKPEPPWLFSLIKQQKSLRVHLHKMDKRDS